MRIALITGGAGGLGFATAERFVKDGMTVVIAELDGKLAEETAAKLPGKGHRGVQMNVADEASVAAAFAKVEKEVGPIAVVAHYAGMVGEGGLAKGIGIAESTLDEWERVNAVNGRGTFLVIREMARHRKEKPVEHGRIITTSSLAAQAGGLQSGGAYSAAKAAVLGLTKYAARDLARYGITVNSIAPGPIDTQMLAAATPASAGGAKYNAIDSIPLRRVGEPSEIAGAAAFLASVEGGYVTGATIDVNGGLYLR